MNKQNKRTNKLKTRFIDADNRIVVTREDGGGERRGRGGGAKHRVTEGGETSGGEHTIESTGVL